MKSASILPSILATHRKMRTGGGITFPRFCFGCATARCVAAKQAPVFTNTRVKRRRLTNRSRSGVVHCTASRKAPRGRIFPPDWHRDPRTLSGLNEEELAKRLILLMVNEAARCVEEKVVGSPEDADYGMILGTG